MDDSFPRHSERLLQHLQDIIQNFACTLDIEETLALTLSSLMRHMHTEAASVFLLTPDKTELVCHACAGPVDLRGVRLGHDKGIAGRAVTTGSVQLIRDTRQADSFFEDVDKETGFQTRSILCSPLQVQDEILGAIELINKLPDPGNPDGLFDDVDAQLLGILGSSAALAIRNATMAKEMLHTRTLQHELALARNIQESFLPAFVEHHPIMGINHAAKNVSGDFFDYMLLPDGRYSFNIGDVSGKGMNAALLMARAHSLYHCLAKTIPSPAAIMAIVNEELSEHATRGMFVTMIGGIYDPRTREVTMANAGHVPAIRHHNNGEFSHFESRNLPLGILGDQVFEEVSFSLADASLYLYTDGLSEGLARVLNQPDEPGILQTLILTHRHLPRQQRLQQFARDASLLDYSFDDLTILLVEDPISAEGSVTMAEGSSLKTAEGSSFKTAEGSSLKTAEGSSLKAAESSSSQAAEAAALPEAESAGFAEGPVCKDDALTEEAELFAAQVTSSFQGSKPSPGSKAPYQKADEPAHD